MLHIMLCIMLHVLDQKAYTPPLKSKSPLQVDQNTCVLRSTFKEGSVQAGLLSRFFENPSTSFKINENQCRLSLVPRSF